jgi:hypothetical protein
MVDTSKTVPSTKPEPPEEASGKPVASPKSGVQKVADEEAHKAVKTEQEYDQKHSIFSK